MPTYEYRCPDGHDFERFFRKISDAPAEVACPVCGKIAERRMSAGAGLLFKGSGFYSTDYRSESYKAAAKKESAPKASESGDKSSKTEPAKTASSGDTKPADKKSAKESA